MNSINNTTKRTPKGERRTRQSWARFFMLAAFCAAAVLSINCNPIICDSNLAVGVAAARADIAR
jgi:hypothetical protein